MVIRHSKSDLAFAYSMDRELAELKREYGIKCKHGLSDDDIRKMRRVAQELGRYKDENGFDFVTARDSGDSSLWKTFTEEKFTDEEKRELMDEWWIHIYSPYDCTGKEFTQWIGFFEVPNGTWIYHRKGIDC